VFGPPAAQGSFALLRDAKRISMLRKTLLVCHLLAPA
jgi:hypothetical protein